MIRYYLLLDVVHFLYTMQLVLSLNVLNNTMLNTDSIMTGISSGGAVSTMHHILLSEPQYDSSYHTHYTHICKEEHLYHVLENNTVPHQAHGAEVILPDPDAPVLPPPYKPDYSTPVYHGISELPIRGEAARPNQYTDCTIPSSDTVT